MNKVSKKDVPKLSSIDFVGLEFSEKKRYRGMPPGLAPVAEPLLDGEIPEVEIIVGDASKFEVTVTPTKSSTIDSDNMDVYKPKVSTWGVFPRPSNISKTVYYPICISSGKWIYSLVDFSLFFSFSIFKLKFETNDQTSWNIG